MQQAVRLFVSIGTNMTDTLVGAATLTPVPGGVGPMTITMLVANTVQAAERSAK